jgi:hypothetical protein
MHEFGLLSDSDALVCMIVNRNDTRLVKGDFVILENDGIRRSEVDSQLLIQKTECHISGTFLVNDGKTFKITKKILHSHYQNERRWKEKNI